MAGERIVSVQVFRCLSIGESDPPTDGERVRKRLGLALGGLARVPKGWWTAIDWGGKAGRWEWNYRDAILPHVIVEVVGLVDIGIWLIWS